MKITDCWHQTHIKSENYEELSEFMKELGFLDFDDYIEKTLKIYNEKYTYEK